MDTLAKGKICLEYICSGSHDHVTLYKHPERSRIINSFSDLFCQKNGKLLQRFLLTSSTKRTIMENFRVGVVVPENDRISRGKYQ